MLINVNPLISPEILSLIRSMGHGDKLVLVMQIFLPIRRAINYFEWMD